MWITDFLGNVISGKGFTTKGKMHMTEALKATILYKELAIQNSISAIAGALVLSEFETFENGHKVKGDNYYLFNIEPNPNQNATEFWTKVVSKLIYTNECLVIQKHGYFYIADSFYKEEFAFTQDVFKDIVVKGTELKETLQSEDIFYFKLNDENILNLINGLFMDYSELLGCAMSGYKRANRTKGILNIDSLLSDEDIKFYEDLMNEDFKKFFNSDNAVLPLKKGFKYEEFKGTSNVKDSRDIKNLINDITEMVASALNVPLGIVRGDVAIVDKQTDNFLMLCVNPKAKMITTEINRKYYRKKGFLNKNYVTMNTQKIRNVDLEKMSKVAEVLFRIGVNNIDDNLELFNREPLGEEWSKERYITKNYQSVEAIKQELETKKGVDNSGTKNNVA